jgi:erythritol kinase
MIAAVQQKIYPDMAACAAQWVEPYLGSAVAPADELASQYDGLFGLYRQTRELMQPIWRDLARLRSGEGHAA